MRLRAPFVLASLLSAVACGGSPEKAARAPVPPVTTARPADVVPARAETPDAPFRANAPKPDGELRFQAPVATEAKLSNGVRVLLVERHELPVVSMRVVVDVGAGDVPKARPGALSFLAAMLEQGTKKRSALEISDDFEALGAQHGTWWEWDGGGLSLTVLSSLLDQGLDVLADVALSPTFPQAEIDRLRARRLSSIQAEKSSPGTIAQNVIKAAVYGREHPYGHSLTGREADAKALGRAELVALYEGLVVPKNVTLVVTGDVSKADILPKLEARFGGLRARRPAITAKPPKTPSKLATDKRLVLVDQPGAQSQIFVARPGFPYATGDREALVLGNAVLGGMFSSRINMNLRERNAYTYGARSYMSMRHGAGPFLAGGAVFADKTTPAIKEIFAEVEGLRHDGPTEAELALAKAYALDGMSGIFETTGGVASAFADLAVYGLPLDDYTARRERFAKVDAAAVKRAVDEVLRKDGLLVVVVGDRAKLAPSLTELGLGEPELRDAWGDPIHAPPPKGK